MAKTKDELMTSAMDEAQKIMEQAKSRLRQVFEGVYNSAYKRGLDDAKVETERTTGKWLPIIEPTAYPSVVRCSECGYIIAFEPYFCPGCGADMRGEQDG